MNTSWFGLGINFTVNSSSASSAISDVTRQIQNVQSVGNQSQGAMRAMSDGLESIRQSYNNFDKALFASFGFNMIGSQIRDFGQGVLAPMIDFGRQTVETGAQFENFRVTLSALYKDGDIANKKITDIVDLASKTPFQITDVMSAVIGFKAVGVEALDTVKVLGKAEGEARSLLEYIGDLAALRPDRGLQNIMLGVQNLLGGDGGRSLRMRMDMNFEEILGEEWAKEPEEIIQQLAKVSDMIANGLMEKLQGTWLQRMSNLADQWTRIKLAVADNGFFDSASNTLGYFSDAVSKLDDEKLKRIGTNLSEAFGMLWKPIDFVARKLTDFVLFLTDKIAESPMLTKLVMMFVGVAGAITTVFGSAVVFSSVLILLYAGLQVFSTVATHFSSIMGFLKMKLLGFLPSLLGIGLALGAVALIWSTDFASIKTILTNFMQNIYTAFTTSSKIASMGANEMITALEYLDNSKWADWLIRKLVEVQVLWEGLVDAFDDNTISDDMMAKLQYLGLIDFVTWVLTAKEAFIQFGIGVGESFKVLQEIAIPIWGAIQTAVGWVLDKLFPVRESTDNVTEGFKFLGIEVSAFKDIGFVIGMLANIMIAMLIGFKVFKVIAGVFGVVKGIFLGIFHVVGGIISGVSTAWGWISIALVFIGKAFLTIIGLGAMVASLPGWLVGLIGAAVVAVVVLIVTLVVKYWEQIKTFFSNVFTAIYNFGKGIFDAVYNFVLDYVTFANESFDKVVKFISDFVEGAKTFFANLVVAIVDGFFALVAFFADLFYTIGETAYNFGQGVRAKFDELVTFISNLWNDFSTLMSGIFSWIWTGITTLATNIWNSFSTLVTFISTLWNDFSTLITGIFSWIWTGITTFATNAWNTFTTLVTNIGNIFSIMGTVISNIVSNIKTWFINLGTNIWNAINTAINNIKTFFSNMGTHVSGIVTNVKNFFSGMGTSISGAVSGAVNNVKNYFGSVWTKVQTVVNSIRGAFSSAGSFIGSTIRGAINTMISAFNSVLNTARNVVNSIGSFFGSVGQKMWSGVRTGINNIIGGLNSMIGSINSKLKFSAPSWVPFIGGKSFSISMPRIPYLNTGGFIKGEGVSYLHPNEVVINDELTTKLREFLNNDGAKGDDKPKENGKSVAQSLSNSVVNNNNSKVDNSVTFGEGAINITIQGGNTTEEQVQELADKLMKEMSKRMKVKKALNYNV